MLRPSDRPSLPAAALLGAVLALASASPVRSQTPTPTMQPRGACPAVVQYRWDVSSVPGATLVRWRLRSPDGVVATSLVDGTAGQVSLDLREYGAVLDGAPFHFQVRPRGTPEPVDWSEEVVFEVDETPALTVEAVGDLAIVLAWQIPPALAPCGEQVEWSVQKTLPPTSRPFTRVLAGTADASQPLDLSAFGYGTYQPTFRVLHEGSTIGRLVELEPITLAAPAPEEPPVAQVRTHTLVVAVLDERAAACAPGATVAGATVTAAGAGQSHAADTDAQGRATLTLPEGDYEIRAERAGCGASAVATRRVKSDGIVDLVLSDCRQTVDVALSYPVDDHGTSTPQGLELRYRIQNFGPAGPPAPSMRLERRADGGGLELVLSTTVPPLCAGELADVTLVDPAPVGGRFDYVLSASAQGDASPANNVLSRVVDVPGGAAPSEPEPLADLNPSVSQSANPLVAGETMIYTVTVENLGQADAAGVVIEATLPEGMDLVETTGTNGFVCAPQAAGATCSGGAIPAGATGTVTIVASLVVTAQSGHTLLFQVAVDPDGAVEEASEINNQAGAVATTEAITLVEHVADGVAAFELARLQGWEHRVVTHSGASRACWMGDDVPGMSEWIRISDLILLFEGPPTHCEFHYFDGPELTAPWRIHRVEFDFEGTLVGAQSVNGICSEIEAQVTALEMNCLDDPPSGSTVPHVSFEAFEEGDEINQMWIRSVILLGPEASDWRDAFE